MIDKILVAHKLNNIVKVITNEIHKRPLRAFSTMGIILQYTCQADNFRSIELITRSRKEL